MLNQLTKNQRHMIECKFTSRANSESENKSVITVKGRQSISRFLSDSFGTQGEFHKCKAGVAIITPLL